MESKANGDVEMRQAETRKPVANHDDKSSNHSNDKGFNSTGVSTENGNPRQEKPCKTTNPIETLNQNQKPPFATLIPPTQNQPPQTLATETDKLHAFTHDQTKTFVFTSNGKSYAAAASTSRTNKKDALKYYPPEFKEGKKEPVTLPIELCERGSKPHENSLYGYFIGAGPHVDFVKNNLWSRWSKFGLEGITKNSLDCYLLKFSNRQGMEQVLEEGQCMVKNMPLFLQRWKPGLKIDKDAHTSVPVWVRIYNIPYEAWNLEAIGRIASNLGKPLDVDRYTEDMCLDNKGRSAFARVLIEMSAAYNWEEVVEVYTWDIETGEKVKNKLKVDYAWSPPRCKECMVYGHNDNQCPRQQKEKHIEVKDSSNASDEDGFTLVGKKQSGQRGQKSNTSTYNLGVNNHTNRSLNVPKGTKQEYGKGGTHKSHFGDSYVNPRWKETNTHTRNTIRTVPIERAFGSVKKILTKNKPEPPKPPNTLDKLFESSKPINNYPQGTPIKVNNMFQSLNTEEDEEEMDQEFDTEVIDLDTVGDEIRHAMRKEKEDKPEATGSEMANIHDVSQ